MLVQVQGQGIRSSGSHSFPPTDLPLRSVPTRRMEELFAGGINLLYEASAWKWCPVYPLRTEAASVGCPGGSQLIPP